MMQNNKIKFTECELIVDEAQIPKIEIFDNINSDNYEADDVNYIVNCEILGDNTLWIYVRYGNAKPYVNRVYDKDTQKSEENPRKQNQIELKNQLFAFFMPKKNVLYISDWKKSTFLEIYLKSKFNKNFSIKKYYTNPEDFIEKITSLESIKFVSGDRNLFNNNIFQEVFDVCGYDMPIIFSLETKYRKKVEINKKGLLEVLKRFKDKKANQEITKMICLGKDDKGIEAKFNLDTYLKSKTFNIEKDNNGMYDENKMKQLLLEQINNE